MAALRAGSAESLTARSLRSVAGNPPRAPLRRGCAALARLAYSDAMPATALAPVRDDPGDEDLMRAYAAGDAAAFDALYARHRGGVYRYLVRQCGNAGTADELFQDVWMSVIRVRASYEATAKFSTWLYRIARNRLIDHWRTSGHVELVSAGADDDDDPLDAVSGARADEPDVRAAAREIGARLRAALAALPPAQREAFLLHQEGGLELAEVATLTGVGTETVKSRIRYALAKLRAELGDLAEDEA
jgi:RNA polymerase sigma-70 factor (ECF subfamily)